MKRICFYTSDYGYGHAARDIAIIRGICKQLDVMVYVKTDVPFEFMKRSLPSVRVIQRSNDVGVSMSGESTVADCAKTGQAVDDWVHSWKSFIGDEKSFCDGAANAGICEANMNIAVTKSVTIKTIPREKRNTDFC